MKTWGRVTHGDVKREGKCLSRRVNTGEKAGRKVVVMVVGGGHGESSKK